MAAKQLSRRQLLVFGGAGCAVAVLGCGSGTAAIPATLDAGLASSIAVGSLRVVSGYPLAIGRDSAGYYALSLICTHEDCDMSQQGSVSTSAIECFCHGSVFDKDGNVTRGPANTPLAHYAVTLSAAGELTVHGDQPVASSTRA